MLTIHPHRAASTYLEIQVAMVLLSIAMAGLYSLSVVQTRQTSRLAAVLPAAETPALNSAPNPWARKLGVYASVDGTVTTADPLVPYVYFEQVADNQDSGSTMDFVRQFPDFWDWYSWNHYNAYRGNAHYHPSLGNSGSYCEFRISGIPPGEYEVLTTYPHLLSLGLSIPHEIYDNHVLRTTVDVNQKSAPDDVTYDGQNWERLAVVQINSGTLRVRLRDGVGGVSYVIGDAILVRSARSLNLLSVSETADGGATATLEAP